ncbi:uncharacterized protein LOC112004925 [Quercus suber]|uniref:uncharacterized protein LOC112004925 n=1 Tax=Quercus suber TaxID=58331 RepID=UPI000D267AC4|nr:putative callose synthase 8 [Quercus suber]
MKFTYVISCQSFGSQKASGDPHADDIIDLMKKYPSLRVAHVEDKEEIVSGKPRKVYSSLLVKATNGYEQVDPTTGETEDDGVEDKYQLEDLEVVAADYMLKVGVSNFRNAWESMGDDCKLIMLFANIMPSSIDGLKNFSINDFYIFINLKLVVPTLKLFVANLQLLKWWSL